MKIAQRLVRLFKADIHAVMDRMEDKQLLLKQYAREMADVVAENKEQLRKMEKDLQHLEKARDRIRGELDKMESDLILSIEKQRDDIARSLIRKMIPLKKYQEKTEMNRLALVKEMAGMAETIEKQRIDIEDLRQKTAAYLQLDGRGRIARKFENFDNYDQEYSEPDCVEADLILLQFKDRSGGGREK